MFASLQSSLGNHVWTTYNLARQTMPPACMNGHASDGALLRPVTAFCYCVLPGFTVYSHHSLRALSLTHVHALVAHAHGVPRRCVSLQVWPPHRAFARYVTTLLCCCLFSASGVDSRFFPSLDPGSTYLLHVDRPKLHTCFAETSMPFVQVCEHSFQISPRLLRYRHDASHALHERVASRAG